VRTRIVRTINEYKWNSHHIYSKKTDKKGIIDPDQVLRMFSEDRAKTRTLYRAYIGDSSSVKKEDIYCTIDQRIIGGEEFKKRNGKGV
jgi:hypothetical protein